MALQRCPECRKKISDSVTHCIHCGFSFKAEDLERYKEVLEQRRQTNAEINRKSVKIHLFWLAVFSLVIAFASWWHS